MAGQRLLFQQRVHHHQAVAGDEAVGPAVLVAVELGGLADDGRVVFQQGKEGMLLLLVAVTFAHGLDDGAGVDALVDVEGDGRNLKGGVLGLARPLQFWVQAGVVGVGGGGRRRGRCWASPGQRAGC